MNHLGIQTEGYLGDYAVDRITLAAVVMGGQGQDPNAYSLVTPEIKQLAKTYEVRVVNFEVVE